MARIIIDLPTLSPEHARILVRDALSDWKRLRDDNYVERRYAHMDTAFRQRRRARLGMERTALEEATVECEGNLQGANHE